ncbi:MAG: transcriptional repressor [Gemmatimonadota bacterium]|nr:transcriptional repressor [Gemmatimonadota bacterium]
MPTSSGHGLDERLRRALGARGQRFTEQRAAVYRYLVSTTSHPTAEDVFVQVREEVDGISLATVYKSLEALVSCGLARKLSPIDGSARYDGDTSPHHHARCLACGCIVDVPDVPGLQAARDVIRAPDGFHVVEARLELSGYCQSCGGLHAREARA